MPQVKKQAKTVKAVEDKPAIIAQIAEEKHAGEPTNVESNRKEVENSMYLEELQKLREEFSSFKSRMVEMNSFGEPAQVTKPDEQAIAQKAKEAVEERVEPLGDILDFKQLGSNHRFALKGTSNWSATMSEPMIENLKYKLARKLYRDDKMLGKDVHEPTVLDSIDKQNVNKSFNYLLKQIKNEWDWDEDMGRYYKQIKGENYHFKARKVPKKSKKEQSDVTLAEKPKEIAEDTREKIEEPKAKPAATPAPVKSFGFEMIPELKFALGLQ